MVTIAVIPARSGSKSIKDKNLQEVGGLSLLERAIQISRGSGLFDSVIVLTDSVQYAAISKAAGAVVPYLRSAATSGDAATDLDVFQEMISMLQLDESCTLAHIRPTTPLRRDEVMKAAWEEFRKKRGQISSMRSVHEMSESAYKTFERSVDGILTAIAGQKLDGQNLPRQFFPKTFMANGYIDLFEVRQVNTGSLHGEDILGFETEPVLEVDSAHDLELIRCQARSMEGKFD